MVLFGATVIDEHVLNLFIARLGPSWGLGLRLELGLRRIPSRRIQWHQRRHLGIFLAGLFVAVFFGLFRVFAAGAGDLEALDIVFLAAAGFGFLLGQ